MKVNPQPTMIYKTLGRSALQISRIAFGCMSLKPAQTDAQIIIDKAIDSGINFFDTSDLYDKGLNETLVGKALKPNRNNVLIATKVGNQWRADGSGWDWNPTKKYILFAVEESLKRLQTDHIDLYQLHGGTIDDPIDDIIEAFEILQQQGKIRFYGISSIRPNVIEQYVNRSNIVSVMMQYNLLDRRPDEACFSLLLNHNIGVLARGSLAGGLLSGKPAKPYLGYTETDVIAISNALKTLTGENNSTAATAINFVLQNKAITSAVVGFSKESQLLDAFKVIHQSDLSAQQLQLLNTVILPKYYEQHR